MPTPPSALYLTLLAGTALASGTAETVAIPTPQAKQPPSLPPAPTLPPPEQTENLLIPAADPELISNCRQLATTPGLKEHERLSLIIAITTALQLGSDPQAEDAQGHSAMLYLSTIPSVLQALKDTGLLKDLKAEQPMPTSQEGLLRLLRTRYQQLEAPLPEASRAYLQSYSLQPAALKARALIEQILRAPIASENSPQTLADCLRFLRAQDETAAQDLVASLPYWEHGEHFLESAPGKLLEALHELNWPVPADKLKQAIRKLDSMLPSSPEDMIDCNAAHPLALLLEMLVQQEGSQAWELVSPYINSRDPEMACAALVLDLHRRGLPGPDAPALRPYLGRLSGDAALQLSELILACQLDKIISQEQIQLLDTERLQRGVTALHKIGAHAHAAIIARHLSQPTPADLPTMLRRLCQEYNYLNTESTRLQAARYILAHPQLFRPTAP